MQINIGKDFSKYPAGRYKVDGPYTGERFRDDLLMPAMIRNEEVFVHLDDAAGYGSSFLEEAFGGLIRSGVTLDRIRSLLKLVSADEALLFEINRYIEDAAQDASRGGR